jgi:hypothetical protein
MIDVPVPPRPGRRVAQPMHGAHHASCQLLALQGAAVSTGQRSSSYRTHYHTWAALSCPTSRSAHRGRDLRPPPWDRELLGQRLQVSLRQASLLVLGEMECSINARSGWSPGIVERPATSPPHATRPRGHGAALRRPEPGWMERRPAPRMPLEVSFILGSLMRPALGFSLVGQTGWSAGLRRANTGALAYHMPYVVSLSSLGPHVRAPGLWPGSTPLYSFWPTVNVLLQIQLAKSVACE